MKLYFYKSLRTKKTGLPVIRTIEPFFMFQNIAYLPLPDIARILAIIVAIGISIFLLILIKSNKHTPSISSTIILLNHLKGNFLYWLLVFSTIFLLIILQFMPYQHSSKKVDEIVTVVGTQWDWAMAHGISNKSSHEFLGKNIISLPVNKKIKFIVTSDDVIHNFAIYTYAGKLVTQVQSIPHYTSELQYIFKQKGKYTVLCLENCGLAHPFMTATINIQ